MLGDNSTTLIPWGLLNGITSCISLENIQGFVGMLNLEFTMFLALTEVAFHGLTGGVYKVPAKPIKEVVRPVSSIQIAIGKMHLPWTTASPTIVASDIDIFVDKVPDPLAMHFVQFPDEKEKGV